MQPAASRATPASPTDILGKLVSFDTTSHKTNLPMAEWVRDYLASHGITATMLPAENGIHTNLFATIGAQRRTGGIGLSGHMDVVPTTGQPWDTDPYTMIEKDGRLYGRGTCDMKGYRRLRPRHGAGIESARTLKTPDPPRVLLRRGGRLHRRQADGRGVRQVAAEARHRFRRRADQHDGGRRAQGRLPLPHRHHRQGRALLQAAARRRRHLASPAI